MTAIVVDFVAARAARILCETAPPQSIETFLAQMGNAARARRDPGREAFWHEVAALLQRKARPPAVSMV